MNLDGVTTLSITDGSCFVVTAAVWNSDISAHGRSTTEVGQHGAPRLPCQLLPAAMEGFNAAAAAAAAGRVARRRRRIGERALSQLARIIGIKRPICRPMIASPSTTWFDSAPARLLGIASQSPRTITARKTSLRPADGRPRRQTAAAGRRDEACSRPGASCWPRVPNERYRRHRGLPHVNSFSRSSATRTAREFALKARVVAVVVVVAVGRRPWTSAATHV